MRLLHDLPDDPEMTGLNESKNKRMKTKTILWIVLAGLLAGCASEKSEQTKQTRLESKAKIARADAQQTALQQVPNGTVKEGEIEKEHGKLIWSFDLATPGAKDITEVNVDAITGAIVSVEKEAPEPEAKDKN
jgi:uncharacterized membrane protein YkoI